MIIRFVCMADGAVSPYDGEYLQGYDAEAHRPDGSYDGGVLVTTPDPAKALRFADAGEAFLAWKKSPSCACHSMRSDGKRNRPLTAFTIAMVPDAG